MSEEIARTTTRTIRDATDAQTVALRIIAGLMIVGACWVMAHLLVPFLLAIVVAVAFSPVATWLERRGLPRGLSALACTLAVLAMVSAATGLVVYEAGTIARDSDRYLKQFGGLLDTAMERTHTGRIAANFGLTDNETSDDHDGDHAQPPHETRKRRLEKPIKSAARHETDDRSDKTTRAGTEEASEPSHEGWESVFRRGLRTFGGWLLTGVGGLLGIFGGGVLSLAFLFYMLQGRHEWVDRVSAAAQRMGMTPDRNLILKVRHEVVTYLGCLAMVAGGYVVVVSLVLWLIGIPQPLLWGLLAGMLEVVPYFGPLVASVMPTLVALSLGSWWQPLAVGGTFLTLHLTEGYLITPMLYGRAVRFDPVTILLGALFFGGLWGPVGLALATPLMIVLRGFLIIAPDTPALDALADISEEKSEAAQASTMKTVSSS